MGLPTLFMKGGKDGMMESNYEKQAIQARELFLNYDQEQMIEKFHLQAEETYLYLPFLDGMYRIGRRDGKIWKREKTTYVLCKEYEVVMTIYDILCYSGERPALAGQWRRLASLQVTHSSPSAEVFSGGYAKKFSGKLPALRDACEILGGEFQSVPASADACYKIPLFPFFPVIFQFWDGDEEFEPRIVILWDKNSLQFLHFETLYYAMRCLLKRLEVLLKIL